MSQLLIEKQSGDNYSPTIFQVRLYFIELDAPEQEADSFYEYYQSLNWCCENGRKVHDWRQQADDWLFNSEA
ncbi:hypothetical protein AB9P05_00760 [Roseivirga sp. BDSF3-8]|uniref:hypothetical protein n=1 Tax=Roseivirga sp. BDSF3-8 TaxID=3241598 RepID=UPI003531E6B1